ncbi:nucleotide exchange factor GrpE [Luteimicrobium subarcticum]|uniref:Protein GrpE n=1 Tax=Luteimicrobium subarcticum TaxID=620910 RepID=A0A2M8W6N1_9MICO|nr:nucleotide exchange factor GrpE [Luteimicrobium subarcticum]PJI86588.1 molecular chaperone GrpE [Luteimicrobium subarcticum]
MTDENASFHFSDKRRIDPETGEPRTPASDAAASDAGAAPDPAAPERGAAPEGAATGGDPLEALDFEPSDDALAGVDSALAAAQAEATAHLDALQRERAEFVNYRNRAKREAEAARSRGVEDVLASLLPVLDDVERARAAGDLTGPFAAISEKLDAALAKHGVERFGAVGEEFDPNLHHALMHQADADATTTRISQVVEPGYKVGDRVFRPANVLVVGPQD